MSQPPNPPADVVVAIGSSAARVLTELDAGPRPPRWLAVTARFPASSLDERASEREFDLGAVGASGEPLAWCRRAAERQRSRIPWADPMERQWLSPAQCYYLLEYHEQHGLLPVFWRLALPAAIGSLHLVVVLSDGLAAVLPELLGSLLRYGDVRGPIHVHAVLPERPTPATRDRHELAWACQALRRLATLRTAGQAHRLLIWLLHEAPRSAKTLAHVTGFLQGLTAEGWPDRLAVLCADLQRQGAWRRESERLWGTYQCLAVDAERRSNAADMTAPWPAAFLPPETMDLTRRFLIDWSAATTAAPGALTPAPGWHVLPDTGRHLAGPARRCCLWLGFAPQSIPGWRELMATAEAAGDFPPAGTRGAAT